MYVDAEKVEARVQFRTCDNMHENLSNIITNPVHVGNNYCIRYQISIRTKLDVNSMNHQ